MLLYWTSFVLNVLWFGQFISLCCGLLPPIFSPMDRNYCSPVTSAKWHKLKTVSHSHFQSALYWHQDKPQCTFLISSALACCIDQRDPFLSAAPFQFIPCCHHHCYHTALKGGKISANMQAFFTSSDEVTFLSFSLTWRNLFCQQEIICNWKISMQKYQSVDIREREKEREGVSLSLTAWGHIHSR